MKSQHPKFIEKHAAAFVPESPFETFLNFLESLNLKDWDDLLSIILERDDDPIVRDVIAPPPNVQSSTYLARLLRQASPQASRLSGVALAALVRRRLSMKRSKQRDQFLTRALILAGRLEGGDPVTVLEDIAFNKAHALAIRLQAAYALSDKQPERLNPAALGSEHIEALTPAILAAARGRNSEWLDLILIIDLPMRHPAKSFEYALGVALRDYEQLKGISGVRALLNQVPASSGIGGAVNKVVSEDPELAHLKVFLDVNLGNKTGVVTKEEEILQKVKNLRDGTRRARVTIWDGIGSDALQDIIGFGQPLPPLTSLSSIVSLSQRGLS